ncbi:MAG: hypothetical protein WC055_00865 [Melioribacteraceae bacterium]
MGVSIHLKCDLCKEEDNTYLLGENQEHYGWTVNNNYCICPECNSKVFDDHAQGQAEKAIHIENIQKLKEE